MIDTFFGAMVWSAFESYKSDICSISNFRSLVEIAGGHFIHYNTIRTEANQIRMPLMMGKAHCIHGLFNIRERTLTAYNSSRLTVRDEMVMNDVEAFAYVLP